MGIVGESGIFVFVVVANCMGLFWDNDTTNQSISETRKTSFEKNGGKENEEEEEKKGVVVLGVGGRARAGRESFQAFLHVITDTEMGHTHTHTWSIHTDNFVTLLKPCVCASVREYPPSGVLMCIYIKVPHLHVRIQRERPGSRCTREYLRILFGELDLVHGVLYN